MQVFGLPGHTSRQGRAASRILDAKAPRYFGYRPRLCPRRMMKSHVAGAGCQSGGPRGGPQPGVPVSLAGPARDQEPVPTLIAFENLNHGLGFGR